MATSAFRSTTKRTSMGNSSTSSSSTDGSSSSNSSGPFHRRSRSLSRFSRPLPSSCDDYSDEAPVPRGRFVNVARGSGFPEISLDDLAVSSFVSADRGRSASRNSEVSPSVDTKACVSERRGRSVVRQGSGVADDEKRNGGNSFSARRVISGNSNTRRRRSVSTVRYRISDSEKELSDLDHSRSSTNGNSKDLLSNKTTASHHCHIPRRSISQRDLRLSDGYSSNSSALTDDEEREAYSNGIGNERTIRTVTSQEKAEHPAGENLNTDLYDTMRKELRQAVEEIKMELGQCHYLPTLQMQNAVKMRTSVLGSDDHLQYRNSEILEAVSTIKRNYAIILEQSEKRKQDLLAEIVLEEHRGKELSKIVKELVPDPKCIAVEKPLRTRKRSNDRNRMSRRLTEEAEKYFEDFISNVEDTDISSLDGERGDTSSALGGVFKSETLQIPAISKSVPVEMDGVLLPWLQWECSNDSSPLSYKNKETTSTPKSRLQGAAQEATPAHDLTLYSMRSRGGESQGITDEHSRYIDEVTRNRFGLQEDQQSRLISGGTRRSRFDVDEYLKRGSGEDLLLEKWRQQHRIHSGSLLLCHQTFLSL